MIAADTSRNSRVGIDETHTDDLASKRTSQMLTIVGNFQSTPTSPNTNRNSRLSIEPSQSSRKDAAGHDTIFAHLLEMLRSEHDRQLATLRHEFESKLNAATQEVTVGEPGRLVAQESGKPASGTYQSHEQLRDISQPSPPQTQIVTGEDHPDASTSKEHKRGSLLSAHGVDWFSGARAALKDGGHKLEHALEEGAKHILGDEEKKLKELANELALLKGWAHSHSHSRSLFFEHIDDAHAASWRKKLIDLVSLPSFDMFSAFAILSNAAFMGAQIDYCARNKENPSKATYFYRVVDRVYTVWFCFELLLKLVAYSCTFFYRPGWKWNTFDLLVVGTDAIQAVSEYMYVEAGLKGLANWSMLRMIRVLRLTRAIRVVRLVRIFRELRMMVSSVMRCGTSLMWSILLFFAIIYIFSIFLLNAVAMFLYEHMSSLNDERFEHYRHYWHSLPQGMWTLFSCMTGGVSWMEVGEPLVHIGWMYGGLLGFFMFFTIFVVTNIITGIFVDTAIQSAQSDRDELVQEMQHNLDSARMQLKRVFEDADADNSGALSVEEFETHLRANDVKAHLSAIGLRVDEARGLFRLLDLDGSNEIGIEEFLFGCMRLKGTASSVDLATLMYENKRLVEEFKKFHKIILQNFNSVSVKLDQQDILHRQILAKRGARDAALADQATDLPGLETNLNREPPAFQWQSSTINGRQLSSVDEEIQEAAIPEHASSPLKGLPPRV